MLARLEKTDGVEGAWVDRHGKRIAIRGKKELDIASVLAKIGLNVEREPGDVRVPGEGWYDRLGSIALSEHEAKVLGERYAEKARRTANLSDEETRKLRAVIERRILERFREYHEGTKSIDRDWVSKEVILQDAAGFLTVEQIETLRKLFDQ